jgi:ketosteroid isomerase-like protein
MAFLLALVCAGCSIISPLSKPAAPARLDDATIRQFVTEQQAAWNARDFDHFYKLCSPDAVFVSIHWNGDGSITRQQRTIDQDRSAAQQFFASHPGKFSEIDTIDNIKIAPDGLSARVLGHGTMHFDAHGKVGVLNATTDQTIVLKDGRIHSLGQIDTTAR